MFQNMVYSPRLCSRCLGQLRLQPKATRTVQRAKPHLTRYLQTQRFGAFAPPSPESLGKAAPPKEYRKTRRLLRILSYLIASSGLVYILDRQFNESSITRSARTFKVGAIVALDYKINFRKNPLFANSLAEVHARNAERVFDLLRVNGGLYLKIGQAIAMQSAILPPAFQRMFAKMFDDAPQNEWKAVERVIKAEFGKDVQQVFGVSFDGNPEFGVIEKTARASASVAQVHWARLKDGREVAIKIQKKEIARQLDWDLWAFNLVPYVAERLSLETDFENEANNSERMKAFIANEPRLRDRVYIPKIYKELSSKRVMTAEWIEGVRLWDKKSLTNPWRGRGGEGSPGYHGTPFSAPKGAQNSIPTSVPKAHSSSPNLKPEREWWKGRDRKGGLGLSLQDVMTTMVDLFSAQMFLWGFVHCDPHPGNILIRRKPHGHAELVLIDHGLYITMSPKFRHEYSLFWKSLLTFDNKTLSSISKAWGIKNADIFASATLMRPYTGGDQFTSQELKKGLHLSSNPTTKKQQEQELAYNLQRKFKKAIREMLSDETLWPHELLFIGRNLRIVQGNNQFLGSPVNRIKITGNWASRALAESPDLSFRERLGNYGKHIVFKLVLFGSDVVFWISWVKQILGVGGGMEDEIEKQMKVVLRELGVETNHGIFDG
ncbi:MAG: hypothetical protein M1834_003491 [Cirrosporium novae-zelandiae]|nr:MAG: hypothetical protein M1834_003491 [Cirrosporium novae-zelandiae]